MGQTKPFRAIALIVEDDLAQREMMCLLLEESDYDVIQCESAEAAERVLARNGGALSLDDHRRQSRRCHERRRACLHREAAPSEARCRRHLGPAAGGPLPDGAKFWSKPWAPLDIAARSGNRRRRSRRRGAGLRPVAVRTHATFAAPGRRDISRSHVALLPADLADRGRLARHRRALYAGGGADQGIARQHRGRVRLHARHPAASCWPRCSGLPRCCMPARWRFRR